MPIVTGKTPEGLVAHAQRALKEKWWYVWGTFGNTLTESLLASKIKHYPQYNNDALHRPHRRRVRGGDLPGRAVCDLSLTSRPKRDKIRP